MDPNVEFYIKLAITFLCSGLIFLAMMKHSKLKEEAAERTFRLKLKSMGMNPDLEESNDDT